MASADISSGQHWRICPELCRWIATNTNTSRPLITPPRVSPPLLEIGKSNTFNQLETKMAKSSV
jgi:hypothetical protein